MIKLFMLIAVVGGGMSALAETNPLEEMFGDSITYFNACEDREGSVEGGLFGKSLRRGSIGFGVKKGDKLTFDLSKPGTMLAWVRVRPGVDPKNFKRQFGFTLFEAGYNGPQHQFLASHQDGTDTVNVFHVSKTKFGNVSVGSAAVSTRYANWGEGVWHLFAVSWNPERFGVSFDGGPWSQSIFSAPQPPFEGHIIWRVPTAPKEYGEDAFEIDELALLDSVIEEDELAAYYRAALDRASGKAVKVKAAKKQNKVAASISFKFAYYPSCNKMHISTDLTGMIGKERAKKIKLEIVNAAGKRIDKTEQTLDKNYRADFFWEVKDLAVETKRSGKRDYKLKMSVDGVKDAEIERDFERGVFEWEGYKGGLSNIVPKPFTPVVKSKVTDGRSRLSESVEKVTVVLRDHIVDKKTGLWQQVTAAGKDLLARPMRFISTSSRSSSDPRESSAASLSSLASTSTWDVDCLYDYRLTLKKGHHEPLSLEIPIKAERAPLMHACVDHLRTNYAGKIPEGVGRVWDGSKAEGRQSLIGDYVPYLWVGGPLRGIAVFGDNDKGWTTSTSTPCQEIIREADGTVVIRLNLIQRPVELTEDQTIRLGFMATPVKPMRENWRSWNAGNLLGCCLYWGGYEDSHVVKPWTGDPKHFEKMAEARRTGVIDKDYMREFCSKYPTGADPTSSTHSNRLKRASIHFHGGMGAMQGGYKHPQNRYVAYTNGRGVHYGTDEGRTFCDEWNRFEYFTRKFSIRSMAAYALNPCSSYLDYAAWWWEKMLASGAIDQLYWDDVYLSASMDEVGTDAYRLSDGRLQPSCGLFDMRAQIRRGAALQAELGKDSTGNWIHMTNTAMAPISAFAGYHYDWEDPHLGNVFQERYSKEYCQACAIGRQMGVKVGVMGYFTKAKKEDLPALKRKSAGVTLTHELGWYIPDSAKEALNNFKWHDPDTKVWNYWDEDVRYPLLVKGNENSSIVFARDGEAMIVVCNYEKCDCTFKLKLAVKTLGLKKGIKAYNAETGEQYAIEKGEIAVPISEYDFAVVHLR